MWQDFRQAIRTLIKHPRFLVLAGVVLALGIGLNVAIFSIARALLYTPLAVSASDELISIYEIFPGQPDRPTVIHTLIYDFLKEHNEVFTDITAHWGVSYTLRADDATDQVNAEWVLSNYFDLLGVKQCSDARSFRRRMTSSILPARSSSAMPSGRAGFNPIRTFSENKSTSASERSRTCPTPSWA